MAAMPPAQGGLPTPKPPENGEPPMGSSPATMPTENAGMEMKGQQGIALIVDAATQLLPMVGAATDIGQLLLDFVKKASKLVPPGSVSPAGKQNQLDEMQRNNAQNSQRMAMIRQSQQAPGGGQQQPPAAA